MRFLKLFTCVLLVLFVFGCKTTNYRWVPNTGLPADCKRTYNDRNLTVEYCIVKEKESNTYYFEGVAVLYNGTQRGQVTSKKIYLGIYKNYEVVKKIPLNVEGTDLSRRFYLHKTFEYEHLLEYSDPFSQVGFAWRIKRR